MLPHTNNPTLPGTRLSAFDRVKMRLGVKSKESNSGQVSNASSNSPTSLLENFHSLKGANKSALLKADAASQDTKVNVSSPARPKLERSPANASSVSDIPSSTDTASALLAKFNAMTGPTKTAYFRSNKSLLKAAAAVVEIEEAAKAQPVKANASREQALRNFGHAQSEAVPWVPGKTLLERFDSLSGTAKTAYFRANRAALKIAAAIVQSN